jgi:hypothetical protein|nr:MAG TPA: AT hook containing protein [Caudoviricetes sp.]
MSENKKKRGRPQKYGEPTLKVSYRIPESFKTHLDNYVKTNLETYKRNKHEYEINHNY